MGFNKREGRLGRLPTANNTTIKLMVEGEASLGGHLLGALTTYGS